MGSLWAHGVVENKDVVGWESLLGDELVEKTRELGWAVHSGNRYGKVRGRGAGEGKKEKDKEKEGEEK